jgi:hypothetical protein
MIVMVIKGAVMENMINLTQSTNGYLQHFYVAQKT